MKANIPGNLVTTVMRLTNRWDGLKCATKSINKLTKYAEYECVCYEVAWEKYLESKWNGVLDKVRKLPSTALSRVSHHWTLFLLVLHSMHACIYVCMCACVYVRLYICICVCMYRQASARTCTSTGSLPECKIYHDWLAPLGFHTSSFPSACSGHLWLILG